MQKQSFRQLPLQYRPYDFPAGFPVLAFLGENWAVNAGEPEYLHFHNGLELGRCLSGKGSICLGGEKSIPFEEGDYCAIFPQTPHMLSSAGAPCLWEFIYLEPKQFLEAVSPGAGLWQPFYLFQTRQALLTEKNLPGLCFLLSGIFTEFHNKKPLYQEAVHGLLLSFLLKYLRTVPESTAGATENENSCACIRTALSYICEHYAEPLTISSLARYCCVSESHFRKLFKAVVGISPLEYLQHCRIRQACHLIHLNMDPIGIIAGKVGYSSLSSFNRQFMQYTHLAPTAWKKEHQTAFCRHEIRSLEDADTKHIFRI